jgi:adenine phosphoribosyltransferase
MFRIKIMTSTADIMANLDKVNKYSMESLKNKIRDIADYPQPGVMFKDITPLIQDAVTLRKTIEHLAAPFHQQDITVVAGMEARGFIFGSMVAMHLGKGFVPLRKPGKLPYETASVDYQLEYGQASLEAHTDAFMPNDKVLLVDDVLATGGTAKASCELMERLGASIAACAFVIELDFLQGRQHLSDYTLHSLVNYS